jgi:phospholipase/lecithinase/hemolysin
MSFAKKILSSAMFACMALSVVPAHAAVPRYDAIYVFGDSLCDVGNIYIYTKKADPPSRMDQSGWNTWPALSACPCSPCLAEEPTTPWAEPG